jgi:hypothetical protein
MLLYIPFHWERLTFDRTSPEAAVVAMSLFLCLGIGLIYNEWRYPSSRAKLAGYCIWTGVCLFGFLLSLVRVIDKLFF